VADAAEPVVNTLDLRVVDVEHPAEPRMEEFPADGLADDIAAGDTGHATGQRAAKRGNWLEAALVDEEPAAGQQELVGYRKPYDAQYQQREDGEIAVSRHPLEDGVFQLERIAKYGG
jgi:hypothetical protein